MLRKLEAKLHILSRRLRGKPVSARMKYEAAGGSWKYDSGSPKHLNSFDTSSNDLLDYFLTNRGRRMNKWLHYFEIYDRHFARFRTKSPIVLEIGVSGGGSLEMWRWYFGTGATIIGVDVNESCAQLRDEGFLIEIGDQADPAFWERFKQRYPRIDILIDDGGHTMKQQRVTFERMFPHVDVRGIYLCEDLHTSYIEKFGGSYRGQETFVEFAKGLVDDLNIRWFQKGTPQGTLPIGTAMHFYSDVVVFEKAALRESPVSATSKGGKLTIRGARQTT